MNKIFSTFLLAALLFAIIGCESGKKELPRIAIAGLAIESSTFSPAVSNEEAFRARYGDSVSPTTPSLLPTRVSSTVPYGFPHCGDMPCPAAS